MSAAIKVNNALNFRSRDLFNRLPMSDRIMSNPIRADKVPVADQVTADFYNIAIPNAASWGNTSVFNIPRMGGLLYDMYLEIQLPADAAVYTTLTCPAAIESYEVSIGQQMIQCSGRSMFEAHRFFMNDEANIRYINYAGGSGGTGLASTSIFMYLDYPGRIRNCVDGGTFSHDDAWGVPFPLNKCNNDMQITIKWRDAANMVSTGATVPSTLTPIIHYQAVNTSNEQVQLTNNSRNNQRLIIPGYRITNTIARVPQTLSNTSALTYDISNTVLDGSNLVNLVSVQLASDVTAKNYFNGDDIANLEENVNGALYYKHNSVGDGSFRNFSLSNANKFTDIAAGTGATLTTKLRTYAVAGNIDPFELFGSEWSCVNLYRAEPQLNIKTANISGSGYLSCIAITKIYYEIDQYGSIMWYTAKTSN
jgi:hypothetical protein